MICTETHMKEPDTFTSEGYKVIHSADAMKDDKGGLVQTFTGITVILAPIYDALTHDLRLVDGRTLTITIDTAQAPLKIIGIYAPHNGLDDELRRKFWEKLEQQITDTPPSTDLVITGDFNAQPTWDFDDDGLIAGPAASPHTPTDPDSNEELLLGLMRRQEMCFPQTWMRKNFTY